MPTRPPFWIVVAIAAGLPAPGGSPGGVEPAGSASGAQPAPPELRARRAEFRDTLRGLLEPLNRNYVAALKKVERELALAGDYESAIAARNERRLVAEILVAANIGEPESDPSEEPAVADPPFSETARTLTLTASEATLTEGATPAGSSVAVGDTDATLTWKLPEPMPGGFDVSVTYSSGGDASLWVRERFFRLKGEIGAGESATVKLGTLKITADADAITLQAIELPPEGLHIESVTLTESPE